MILDTLENAQRYYALHPRFARAFAFLRDAPMSQSADRHELDGPRLYAMVTQDNGKSIEAAKLEAHRKYIDIHFEIAGGEQIGWRGVERCTKIDSPYSEEKDFLTFFDPSESWSLLSPGTFAIYFPWDAHAPMVSAGRVHKIVIKVAL